MECEIPGAAWSVILTCLRQIITPAYRQAGIVKKLNRLLRIQWTALQAGNGFQQRLGKHRLSPAVMDAFMIIKSLEFSAMLIEIKTM
ncbi:MAG: hypothetical protein J0M10_15480 [Chitinophagales bacterium]|nr:hypothetical protein [Chitinophagales bacterium]